MPLKLTRRHGSPFWYIRGSVRGVRVDESTGVSERKAAEEVLIKRGAEIQQRAIHGDSASRTFGEAALSYMEAGGEREHLAPILKLLGRKKLGAIGQAEIDDVAHKLFPRASNATRNRKAYTPISAVLHHAARKRWCPAPVIARPEQPSGRVRSIDFEEAERLIAAASPHMQPLVIFLLGTGARLSEALYLDWREVDLSRGHVVFLDTKNGTSRGVPLHARVVAALANLPWDRKGAVFRRPGRPGDPHKWMPYEERAGGGGQVKTGWAGMLKRAKLSNFTPHDCRHTWATWHYAANRDVRALMELGGWKSLAMVARYTHVNSAHLAPGISKMWGHDGEQPSAGAANVLTMNG